GAGIDAMAGGAGNDTYRINATTDVVTEAANAGHATLELNVAHMSYVMGANIEDAVVFFGGGYDSEGHTITGNGLDNFIAGDYGSQTPPGRAGADAHFRHAA